LNTFLTTGIVLIAAALVGGRIKLAGNEVPVISTIERQALVFALGAALLIAPYVVSQGKHLRITGVEIAPGQET
jgi:hypothetical protein